MLALDDQISDDGVKWARIGDQPLLAGFFKLWAQGMPLTAPTAVPTGAMEQAVKSYGNDGAPGFGNAYQSALKAGGTASASDDEGDPREHTDEEFIGIRGRSSLSKQAREDAYGQRAEATNDRTVQDDPVLIRGRQRDQRPKPQPTPSVDPVEETGESLVSGAFMDRKAETTASRESTVERPMAPEDTDHNLQTLVDKAAERSEVTAVFEDEASSEREHSSRSMGGADSWEDSSFKATVKRQTVNAEETIVLDMKREQARRYTILGGLVVVFLVGLFFALGDCSGDGGAQDGDVLEAVAESTPAPVPAPVPAAAAPVEVPTDVIQAPEPAAEPEVVEAPREEVAPEPTPEAAPDVSAPQPEEVRAPEPEVPEEPAAAPPAPPVQEEPTPAPVVAPTPAPAAEPKPRPRPEPAVVAPVEARSPDRVKDPSEIDDYEDLMSAGDFYRKTELAKALTYYQKAVDLRPGGAEAPYKAGDCCYQLGKHQQAVEFFDLAIQRGRYRAAYSRAAQAYKKMGNQEAAIKILETGLSHYPGDPLMRSLVESYR
jgi:hypothetical protein